MNYRNVLIFIGLIVVFVGGWWLSVDQHLLEPKKFKEPLGLPPVRWPEKNPFSWAKVDLGRKLFFDKRLSSNNTVSCASCHRVPQAFGDPDTLAIGIENHKGKRHAPTIINAAYNDYQFWDGRVRTLEEQVLGPISNPNEMTLEKTPQSAFSNCQSRIRKIGEYRSLFSQIFGHEECFLEDIAMAIATFERTILSGNSPYDRYQAGDKSALTAEQIHGLTLFKKVGCVNCHLGGNFTNNRFENIGIGMDVVNPDLGRYVVTKNERDWGAFKVPTLREVSQTAPYMHDGSLATLEEVIDYYDRGGIPNKNLHPLMQPLYLSSEDRKDLVAFLKSLNGEGWEEAFPRVREKDNVEL